MLSFECTYCCEFLLNFCDPIWRIVWVCYIILIDSNVAPCSAQY